jgi:hypothetical protein
MVVSKMYLNYYGDVIRQILIYIIIIIATSASRLVKMAS